MILAVNYGILKSLWYNSDINHDERTSSGLDMDIIARRLVDNPCDSCEWTTSFNRSSP